MIKINEYSPIKSAGAAAKKSSTGGTSGFAELLDTGNVSEVVSHGVSDVGQTSGIHNLLALQEVSEEEHNRKKWIKHGTNMLNSLDTIRKQLLMGGISHGMLKELSSQLSTEKQGINDPALLEIMEEIELRAAVELAKLEVASSRN